MSDAFQYAIRQLLGMQFEPFTHQAPDGAVYAYTGRNQAALRLLLRAAEWLFARSVEVR